MSGEELRHLMRFVPSPVSILTFSGDGGPRGVTIGSFTSVSLNPPLISFNLMSSGTAHKIFLKNEYFAIHFLRHDQAKLSSHFAIPELSSELQFADVTYEYSDEGIPLLKHCIAVLICNFYDILAAGDHSLILGRVLKGKILEPSRPLLYFQQAYHEIGDPVR